MKLTQVQQQLQSQQRRAWNLSWRKLHLFSNARMISIINYSFNNKSTNNINNNKITSSSMTKKRTLYQNKRRYELVELVEIIKKMIIPMERSRLGYIKEYWMGVAPLRVLVFRLPKLCQDRHRVDRQLYISRRECLGCRLIHHK